jgi:hypothetical protein
MEIHQFKVWQNSAIWPGRDPFFVNASDNTRDSSEPIEFQSHSGTRESCYSWVVARSCSLFIVNCIS